MTFNIIERFDITLISSNSCMSQTKDSSCVLTTSSQKLLVHWQRASVAKASEREWMRAQCVYYIVHRTNVSGVCVCLCRLSFRWVVSNMNPMNHGHFYNLDTCKHLSHNRFDDEDVLFLVAFFSVLFTASAMWLWLLVVVRANDTCSAFIFATELADKSSSIGKKALLSQHLINLHAHQKD